MKFAVSIANNTDLLLNAGRRGKNIGTRVYNARHARLKLRYLWLLRRSSAVLEAPMGTTFPVDEAFLVAAWFESFWWGVFTVTFGVTMFKIMRRGWSKANKITTVSICILYTMATSQMAITLKMLIEAFITYRETLGPVAYYEDRHRILYRAGDELYISTIIVADAIVVWRLYVVYGKSLLAVAFPIIMIIGTAVAGYGAIQQFDIPDVKYEVAFAWGTAMYTTTFTTNIIVTLATALRIWYVSRRNDKAIGALRPRYHRVLLLIIESGAVLAVAKLIEFILYRLTFNAGLGGDHALWVMMESMPQIMGLLPTLIVLAVNSGFTCNDEFYTNSISGSMAFAPNIDMPTTTTAMSASTDIEGTPANSKMTLLDIPLYPVTSEAVRPAPAKGAHMYEG